MKMKIEISIQEDVQLIKEIKQNLVKILEIVKVKMPKVLGEYLTMRLGLTRFLRKQPYERVEGVEPNYHNGPYPRSLVLKGFGIVPLPILGTAR